jgi:2-oxoisovalerate dehydrogenase E1 component alpha subunit
MLLPNEPAGFHVPDPPSRDDGGVSFGDLRLSPAGAVPKPAITAPSHEMRDLAYGLIRVLTDTGEAVGPWDPKLPPEVMKRGLEMMLLTRAFDDRMFRCQRQGKTTFYIKSAGEEAISCAQAAALDAHDMCFPSYRQQGILLSRGYPMVGMINQIYNNTADPLKGHQLPILYSSKAYGYYSLSGNVGSRFPHAVGWAMASAYRGRDDVAAAWIGEGSTAEGDFHHALTFASVYRAPVILNIVNNQWAISSFQGIAGGGETTFAARGIGYGLPSLRVDGNDFLAVYSATAWARARAQAKLGATVIELLTYRADGHSTSDDPTKYRPKNAAHAWPLGDPLDRLKRHLIALGEWTEDKHETLQKDVAARVKTAADEAETIGSFGQAPPSAKSMFEDVFKEPDWRLREQRQSLGI